MLTAKGYRDRFWQGYPELRRILDDKELSVPEDVLLMSAFPEDQWLPSTWQGSTGRLNDVLRIVRLLQKHGGDLQRAMATGPSPAEQILEEISRLVDELEGRTQAFLSAFTRSFRRDVEATRTVARDVADIRDRLAREQAEKQVRPQNIVPGEEA
jgi:hypothetical protein